MQRFLLALFVATVWADICPEKLSIGPCRKNPANTCPDEDAVCDTDSQLCCKKNKMFRYCEDKVNPQTGYSDCPKIKQFCGNKNYMVTMHENCPLTCGFCTPSYVHTPKPVCKDQLNDDNYNECKENVSRCTDPDWKEVMKKQCPKTCGYC